MPDVISTTRVVPAPTGSGRRTRRHLAVWVVWLVTRLPLFFILAIQFPRHGDVVTYRGWLRYFLAGTYPVADHRWQYPPGAAAVLTLPHLIPGDYVSAFLLCMLAADLGVTLVLTRMARRNGSWLGCWFWLAAVPLLGSTSLVRFDMVPTLLAVLALCALGSGAVSGAFAGLGAVVKVWPALVLIGVPRGQGGRALTGAAATAGLTVAGYLATTRGSWGFLHNQGSRGLEVESLGAVPFLLLRSVGLWRGRIAQQYGSVQLTGPGVSDVATALLVASVVALLGLLAWRGVMRWRPATTADAALVATLLMVDTSRVLSPQYLVWLLGLAAAALTFPRTSQRPVAAMLLAAAALTWLDFPMLFDNLVLFGPMGVTVLTLRDAVLLAATVIGCVRLWRQTRPPRPAAVPPTELPAGLPAGGGTRLS